MSDTVTEPPDGECCICNESTVEPRNILLKCGGYECKVTVHQNCYGVRNKPRRGGVWNCKKCSSQDWRPQCLFCPTPDSALKQTSTGEWVHIVCALYIPEVTFQSVAAMEPILIHDVKPHRYQKTCIFCERSSMGACIKCHNTKCKRYFHVTCAQKERLLREEDGTDPTRPDALLYVGYCKVHVTPKVKKEIKEVVTNHKKLNKRRTAQTFVNSSRRKSNGVNGDMSKLTLEEAVNETSEAASEKQGDSKKSVNSSIKGKNGYSTKKLNGVTPDLTFNGFLSNIPSEYQGYAETILKRAVNEGYQNKMDFYQLMKAENSELESKVERLEKKLATSKGISSNLDEATTALLSNNTNLDLTNENPLLPAEEKSSELNGEKPESEIDSQEFNSQLVNNCHVS